MCCRVLQQQASSVAAQQGRWDKERAAIVQDMIQLASQRQGSVLAMQDDLDTRLAAARQQSLVSALKCSQLDCSGASAAIVQDMIQLTKRQDSVHAMQDNLDTRLAAARQLSLVSGLKCSESTFFERQL